MNGIKDYPVSEEYPYADDVCDDIDRNLICTDRDTNVTIKCSIRDLVGVTKYVVRDRKEFVKIYREGIRAMLDLSYTAQRVMAYIMDMMKPGCQYVEIIPSNCMAACGFKTPKSVRDGIIELLGKNIISRNPYTMRYWVNPLLVFNGDRIEFVRQYVLKSE